MVALRMSAIPFIRFERSLGRRSEDAVTNSFRRLRAPMRLERGEPAVAPAHARGD